MPLRLFFFSGGVFFFVILCSENCHQRVVGRSFRAVLLSLLLIWCGVAFLLSSFESCHVLFGGAAVHPSFEWNE